MTHIQAPTVTVWERAGKVSGLPEGGEGQGQGVAAAAGSAAADRGGIETAVAKVWCEVLELPPEMVDAEESFFDQGKKPTILTPHTSVVSR